MAVMKKYKRECCILLKDIWVASGFEKLVKLLETFLCKLFLRKLHFFGYMLSDETVMS
jgi:hypothetical protein